MLRRSLRGFAAALSAFASALSSSVACADDLPEVDTALILAVDISDSVDADRYKLQMEGIARALEDPSVISTITSGPRGGIGLTLVEWTDTAAMTVPWRIIRSEVDAKAMAATVRGLVQRKGEYTCVSRMLAHVRERITSELPLNATRVVLDVSGDGIDNCREPDATTFERDALVATGVQINGLPIIVAGENEIVGAGAYRAPGFGLGALAIGPGTHQTTLDQWYTDYVVGGPAGFLIRANGFEDFERAFKQKFVSEISLAQ
ncbi:MAG: DUF1194 domain-containing protein [Hyphomicrobium sp.]|nr:DUF1194 domain-containing protein [Hyphomicrobium sp.]